MERQRLEIKGDADKLTVASILVANGYTVRMVSVRDDSKRAINVLEFYKEKN